MKKILAERRKGKTTQLIQLSAVSGHYIVCRSPAEAGRICAVANEMGKNIPTPITYEEFLNRNYYAKGIGGFLIDNADHLLMAMSPVPITAITMDID